MMIGRTLIDELLERRLMIQQPADADDARKNKRADSARMQKDGERQRNLNIIPEAQGSS
jgi:hypothetical protein